MDQQQVVKVVDPETIRLSRNRHRRTGKWLCAVAIFLVVGLATPVAHAADIAGSPFKDRTGHGVLVFEGAMWVIGGADPEYRNDVWHSTDGATWTPATAQAEFSPRFGHACVVFDGKMWVIGGNTGTGFGLDVWHSTDGVTWTLAPAPVGTSPATHLYTGVVFDDKIWLIGGDHAWFSANGITWTRVALSFSMPDEHVSAVHDGKIWVLFGNQVWSSSDGVTWSRMPDAPFSRLTPGCAVFDNNLWIVGGKQDNNHMRDLWHSSNGETWTQVTDAAALAGRHAHRCLAYDNKIWVIAGLGDYQGDVWLSKNGRDWYDALLFNDATDTGHDGALRVTLGPAQAVAAGARWRVVGQSWREPGEEPLSLRSGLCRIQCMAIPGWKAMDAAEAVVVPGKELALHFEYQPVESYALGEVPPLTVRHGDSAAFEIQCDAMTVEGLASGRTEPTFDPATRLFTYAPGATDREPFQVTFRAQSNGVEVFQEVFVQPLGNLLPEQNILQFKRPLPNPASSDYLVVSDIQSQGTEIRNHRDEAIHTHGVTVTGKTVIIEDGGTDNDLFARYNGRDDIKRFTVYAEELIVRSPFHLPQTDVTIHARRLTFEDKNPAQPAAIITTPRTDEIRPETTGNGKDGLQAGAMRVHVERFAAPVGGPRFILKGGDGQQAGHGQDGAPGVTVPHRSTTYKDCSNANIANVIQVIKSGGTYEWGYNEPFSNLNGKDATSPGKSGEAGNGGDFHSTLNLNHFAAASGGAAGAIAPDALGGARGTPNPARQIRQAYCTWIKIEHKITITHHSVAGADAPAPRAIKPLGAAGMVTFDENSLAWFRPEILRPILLYVKDAYLNGTLDYVQETLTEYLGLLDAYKDEYLADSENEFAQLRAEMENLLHRASNNLDYFGNPAGWVPMLSLEANTALYEHEIGRAIRTLYLSYWLKNAERSRDEQIAAMTGARDRLREEISEFTERLNLARALIPGLETNRERIGRQIGAVEVELAHLEKALLRRAEGGPWWKKALRVMSVVCKILPIPGVQPALAAIGTGLDLVTGISVNKPLDAFGQIQSAVNSFDGNQYQTDASNLLSKINSMGPPANLDHTTAGDWFKNLQVGAKDLTSQLMPIKDIVKSTQAPKSEIEAELLKIKATDKSFAKVVDRLRLLNMEKEVFAVQLAETMQVVTHMANGVTHNILAVDETSRAIAGQLEQRNHAAMQYVREMEQRARDRLLKYQYYVVKAFEYRMLEQYPSGETFKLDRLFDAFAKMLENGDDPLTYADFQVLSALYEEEIDTMIGTIVDRLNTYPPEKSRPYWLALSQDELRVLNEGGEVVINLMDKGLLSELEDNVRITMLKTEHIAVDASQAGPVKRCDIVYEHSGLSRLEWEGVVYHFTHIHSSNNRPIRWKTSYNAHASPPTWEEHTEAEAAQSLVRFLMNRAGVTDPHIMRYSRPSAWADIVVRKSGDPGMRVQELVIEFRCDYFDKQATQATLTVRAHDDLMPRVLVSHVDNNSRQDGDASFHRVYNRNAEIQLTAPLTYGDWAFEGWATSAGPTTRMVGGQAFMDYSAPKLRMVSVTPTINVNMNSNRTIHARYRQTATELVEPLVSGTDSPTIERRPTWTWWTGGGSGAGMYRYGWSQGSWIAEDVTHTSYTPTTDLQLGAHTLYVQERDDALLWSSSGSYEVLVGAASDFGSLMVTITPGGAIDAGAQWRRVGQTTWRDSGATEVNVPVGVHGVQFKEVDGWLTPADETATIVAGQTANAGGNYSPGNTPTPTWTGQPTSTPMPTPINGVRQHPADLDGNMRLAVGEVTGYGAAWKRGDAWSVAPNPIPINYVTRAGYLWRNGEQYQDVGGDPPTCWSPPQALVAKTYNRLDVTLPSSLAERSITGNGTTNPTVSIAVAPGSGVSAYAVEDTLPVELTAGEISHGGAWDAVNRKVKWGPYFDSEARNLSYTISGPDGSHALSGIASFDGIDVSIAGDGQVIVGGQPLPTATPAASSADRTLTGNGTTNPTVSIAVAPGSGVSAYAVEDTLPAELTAGDINHGGAWDAVNRKVKWGPFFDSDARNLSYTVSGPDGSHALSGIASFDGVDVPIAGVSQVTLSQESSLVGDLNNDGKVDHLDLLLFMQNWGVHRR